MLLSSLDSALNIIVNRDSSSEDKTQINFSWNITDFTENQMKILLNFTSASEIS